MTRDEYRTVLRILEDNLGPESLAVVLGILHQHKPREGRLTRAPHGECQICDNLRSEGESFAPPHEASPNCKSGGYNHCSCDTCF